MSKIIDSIARAKLTSPKIIILTITNSCNLSCHHCLSESLFYDTIAPVPTDAIKRMIEELCLLRVEEICFTGGEPLTHPDWFEIVAFACKQHNLNRVCLQTNATLLTEEDVEALCTIDSKSLTLQVSLEGSNAKTNDKVRGDGSFKQIIRGLKLLSEAGLGQQVVVAFTEMQHNFVQLPDLLRLLDGLGIGGLVSGTLLLSGRAAQNDQITPPAPSQYRELLELYHSDSQFKALYKKLGNIVALEWFSGKSYPSNACCSCIERPYINAAGVMYPCPMLQIESLSVKDAYKRPLDEVLLEGLPLWRELSDLHHRRSVELKECVNCPGQEHCAGGCMGRAYSSTGDFMTVEDRCSLRKEVYSWELKTK